MKEKAPMGDVSVGEICEKIAAEMSAGKTGRTREWMYDIAKEAAELALSSAQSSIQRAEAQLEEARKVLERSASAMEKAQSWIEAEHSETQFEMDGALSSVDAELHVTAYDAHTFLASLREKQE